MAVWLIRAGLHGEYEHTFIQENCVYVTRDGLDAKAQADLETARRHIDAMLLGDAA